MFDFTMSALSALTTVALYGSLAYLTVAFALFVARKPVTSPVTEQPDLSPEAILDDNMDLDLPDYVDLFQAAESRACVETEVPTAETTIQSMSIRDLKAQAKALTGTDRAIKGYGSLTKDQLLGALLDRRVGQA